LPEGQQGGTRHSRKATPTPLHDVAKTPIAAASSAAIVGRSLMVTRHVASVKAFGVVVRRQRAR
jgi:hypothetical protein